MRTTIAIAAVIWPLTLGAALWQHVSGNPSLWTASVYFAASHVCHQRADRSFHTAGAKWPVCARCAALYLAAPLGALIAVRPARGTRELHRSPVRWLVAASIPTILTVVLERAGMPITNHVRALAGLPLGAVAAAVVTGVAPERWRSFR